MVDASDARAARFGRSRHYFAKRAQGAGHDNDFSVHGASPKGFGNDQTSVTILRAATIRVIARSELRRSNPPFARCSDHGLPRWRSQ
jgi:hypothetical protein